MTYDIHTISCWTVKFSCILYIISPDAPFVDTVFIVYVS
jgi:hypothetical protein